MKTLLLILTLAGVAQASDWAETYANNAILNAAEHGQKHVTLVFGNAPLDEIERVADDLRARGYVLDEQAELLNPRIVKILRLRAHKEG
jgi:hypothetical protein